MTNIDLHSRVSIAGEYPNVARASEIFFGSRRATAIRKAIRNGELTVYQIGRSRCVKRAEVVAWIETHAKPRQVSPTLHAQRRVAEISQTERERAERRKKQESAQ